MLIMIRTIGIHTPDIPIAIRLIFQSSLTAPQKKLLLMFNRGMLFFLRRTRRSEDITRSLSSKEGDILERRVTRRERWRGPWRGPWRAGRTDDREGPGCSLNDTCWSWGAVALLELRVLLRSRSSRSSRSSRWVDESVETASELMGDDIMGLIICNKGRKRKCCCVTKTKTISWGCEWEGFYKVSSLPSGKKILKPFNETFLIFYSQNALEDNYYIVPTRRST